MRITNKSLVEKIRLGYRILAGFFLFCTIFGLIGISYAIYSEPFDYMLLIIFPLILLSSHISACLVFSGYAPRYLLFSHGPKKLRPLPNSLIDEIKDRSGVYGLKIYSDDITHMGFVVSLLKEYLGLTKEEAIENMLGIHNNGSETLLNLEKSTAESLISEINREARLRDFPLKVSLIKKA